MRNAFIGAVLMLVAVLAVQFSLQHLEEKKNLIEERNNPLNIPNLKKAEAEKLKILEDQPERLEKYKTHYLSLARKDASAFVDKTIPLNKPHMSTTQVVTWLSFAVTETMTFSFNDQRAELSLASDYFTESGWKNYRDSLESNKSFVMFKDSQQLLTATPKAAPVVLSEGEVKGVYQWVVKMPMILSSRSSEKTKNVIKTPMILSSRSGEKTKNTIMLVAVIIKRTNDPNNAYGIAIDQWMAMPR